MTLTTVSATVLYCDLPNTTHCDSLHLLSDDLPIFDELCRRSLMFIYKCFFHSSSLVKFVTRYAVMFARYKSTLGSNFLLCVSRFGFRLFLNGSININYVFRHHCLSVTDNNHFYVAQFMRESIVMRDAAGRHGCSNLLSRSEISCIMQYLACLLRPYLTV